jgi:plasmid stabilization system protein ParE
MVDRLTRRSQQIGEFPLSGRMVPEYEMTQIREVVEGPYRIIYHLRRCLKSRIIVAWASSP